MNKKTIIMSIECGILFTALFKTNHRKPTTNNQQPTTSDYPGEFLISMGGFNIGDKCMAYHGPLLYEAKVLKIHDPGAEFALIREGTEELELDEIPEDLRDEKVYYIHYKGWKSTWDEWVGTSRLKELNMESRKIQKELMKAALHSTSSVSANNKKSIDVSKSTNGTSNRANKKRAEMGMEIEEEYLKKPEIFIIIPDELKSLIVDDWEYVTKEHQLVKLPAKPNIESILAEFKKFSNKKSIVERGILEEFLKGITIFFNRSLGHILLYRFERQQYEKLKDSEDLTKIYGVEHLMRLLISMPALIAQTTMDQQSVGTLKSQLEDFLEFLNLYRRELFLKNYENASPEYDALAKTA